ncbi:MarR family winged helix-turn-helix transcriptional regulator [Vagococcus lutrae]|uniref:MarR family winged helix-turn-helix transcriptional regulator n=1 Tax=Vagococcus lutrae TaxID=81947 RepID=UPI001443EA69|nr:MarR family transcriptional regulator [Vagococcus lutrae]MDT2805181.1 MarR family transcriptional regulator [Vagococcus lutrae]MDT2824059.1 MarR family transcriptional regulator [Vagococcus lutrae]NKZ27162.1 MarR family transcriptional regulator [Vagococcus lutrae]UQF19280.1 MarR family transcriptional regulator [Vagococcus lutrae]
MTMEEEVKQISSFIRIFSSYLNSLEKKMANEMLTFNEIRVMLELHDNEQLSAKDIEQRLDFDKSYMSRILKNLSEMGYISKDQSSEDKRLFHLSLTEEGKELSQSLYEQYLDILEDEIEDLSAAEKNQLLKAIRFVERHYDELDEHVAENDTND